MKRPDNKDTFFIISALCVLVPVTGRFAYGIIMAVALNWLMLWGTLMKVLIKKLDLKEFGSFALIIVLVSCVMLFSMLLSLFSPVLALAMGFSLYMTVFSAFILGAVFNPEDKKIIQTSGVAAVLKQNMKKSALFSVLLLVFYFLRDILGYGTITLPVMSGLWEKNIIYWSSQQFSVFWGSTGGAYILLGVILGVCSLITRKTAIAREAER